MKGYGVMQMEKGKIYDYNTVPTPCFVVEEELLKNNLEILKSVIDRTGCHILLAQKCFSMYHTYPLLSKYLSGTTASGLYEAKLGKEYFGKETHVYSAAYRDDEIDELLDICDHIVFNSFSQWNRFKDKAKKKDIKCGLRINPKCSTQEGHAIYDPCAPYSRMGITNENFDRENLEGISGLHFHTLCEQNSDDLLTTIKSVKEQFSDVLKEMEWINFGGGHHITRKDYDIECLVDCINEMKEEYGLEVYLEPGEAVALDAGFMISTVLDIVSNGIDIAIVDTSAACHMPDVIEMPYTPQLAEAVRIVAAGGETYDKDLSVKSMMEEQETFKLYRIGGPTCLAGDVIGDYIFDRDLKIGDRLTFKDMAIYSMVKTNTFNGMRLPAIAYKDKEGIKIIKKFGYEDFKNRL